MISFSCLLAVEEADICREGREEISMTQQASLLSTSTAELQRQILVSTDQSADVMKETVSPRMRAAARRPVW